MNKLTIFPGFHRPISLIPAFLRNLRLDRSNPQILTYKIRFDDSCRYSLPSEDQFDWNKLIGWGIFKLFKSHQYNSVRVVWRYNKVTDKIEIAPYYYIKGNRILPDLHSITSYDIGDEIEISLLIFGNDITIKLVGPNGIEEFYKVNDDISTGFLYGCWFYFGGNNVAPKRITIHYERIKN